MRVLRVRTQKVSEERQYYLQAVKIPFACSFMFIKPTLPPVCLLSNAAPHSLVDVAASRLCHVRAPSLRLPVVLVVPLL